VEDGLDRAAHRLRHRGRQAARGDGDHDAELREAARDDRGGDRDGDRRGGCTTYPVLHGDDASVRGMWRFFAAWVALAAVWPPVTGVAVSPTVYYAGLAVTAVANAVAVTGVARAVRPIPRAVCVRAHEVVVAERIALGTFLPAAAGRWDVALLVGGPSLAVTLVARAVMRGRYEPARA
jgi:4-hydroxybenzoate polyprenyltransferase/geranylgeranylglycerol-phosphate geranylgeranyltransferase